MRNLQHSKELLQVSEILITFQNDNEDYEKERKDKCLSTNLERNIIDTPLELNMSSEYDEYSDFSEDSTQKLPDDATRDDNEHELIKNIEKVIKGNRNKNNDKQRLSVNHSAQLLE